MSFSFTEEHEELRQMVRRFLDDKSDSAAVRALIDAGDRRDELVWKQMADQLGLQGLAIPEEYGGSGFGPIELGIVMEEMGRRLLVSPYFATVVLAGQALVGSGDDAASRRWLPGIADGSLTATVAVADRDGGWDLDAVQTRATAVQDRWTVTGTKRFVVDGGDADLVLVVARDGDGLGVFAVEADAPGLERVVDPALDLTRELATLTLSDTPATRVGEGTDTVAWLAALRDQVLAALAAEQMGGAAACLDMAVEYAKVREQFGRPIGSFQAIKHKAAAMLLEVESGRSAAYHAMSVVHEPGAESAVSAALAKSYCSEAFTHTAKENIQIHGGIGFTWEHDAHLYLRRAKSSELMFGTPAHQRARLAELIGL